MKVSIDPAGKLRTRRSSCSFEAFFSGALIGSELSGASLLSFSRTSSNLNLGVCRIRGSGIGQFLFRRLQESIPQAPFGQFEMILDAVLRRCPARRCRIAVFDGAADHRHAGPRDVDFAVLEVHVIAVAGRGDRAFDHFAIVQQQDARLRRQRQIVGRGDQPLRSHGQCQCDSNGSAHGGQRVGERRRGVKIGDC